MPEKKQKSNRGARESILSVFDQVLVGAGSDAGSISTPHPSLLGELHTMNKYVNNPRDILKTATVNAGKILGIPTGQITEGYFADFILMDQNPLLDLNHLEEIKEVYLEGKRFV